MNVHIANYQADKVGGGWTAARYLADGLGNVPYNQADVYLVCGPTQASHGEVEQAKRDGKKVVLRVDNAVRDSRNRGTGMSRLKSFCDQADLVIYQSEWARRFLLSYTGTDGPVVLNGVDTKHFCPGNPQPNTYLYSRSSRDEGKQWIAAWYWFVNNPGRLSIVGKFSRENIEYGFDFFNNEQYRFYGEVKDMLPFYQNNKYFLYSYLNDACSNTLLEARACGMEIIDVYGMLHTGGAPEIMACQDISVERMVREYEQHISSIA